MTEFIHKKIELKDMEGKTIKKVVTDNIDGLQLEFTDGVKVVLIDCQYPDGSYDFTSIDLLEEE